MTDDGIDHIAQGDQTRRSLRWVLPTCGGIVAILIWHIAAATLVDESSVLPSPVAVVAALAEMWRSGDLRVDAAASLNRIVIGFLMAFAAAVLLGLLAVRSRPTFRGVEGIMHVVGSIPPIAWTPIAILWFGIGDVPAYFIVFLGAFFPMFSGIYSGVTHVSESLTDAARTLGASRWMIAREVIVPAALPEVFTGLKTGITVAWFNVIAAELVGVRSGLGYRIQLSRTLLQSENVVALMLVIGLVGLLNCKALLHSAREFTRKQVSSFGQADCPNPLGGASERRRTHGPPRPHAGRCARGDLRMTPRPAWTLDLAFLAASFALFFVPGGCGDSQTDKPAAPASVRIGWQTAWATQGQLAHVLQRTNTLELEGLSGDFKSFLYGAPLTEAAVAGEIDIALLGDQPAVNLVSKSPNWTIVARLMDFRVALLVPPTSDIKTLSDLRGKTIGIPFGASTHRTTLEMLRAAGLDPNKDVTLRNVDIQEQGEIIKAGRSTGWGEIQAFASWDPHIAVAEKNGTARVLAAGKALGIIAASEQALKQSDDRVARFLASVKLSWTFYARNRQLVDGWFSTATQGSIAPDLLARVAEVEGNTTGTDLKTVRLALSQVDVAALQAAADFAAKEKLIKAELDITSKIAPAPSSSADKLLDRDPAVVTKVHVKK